jgi:hypothetical protein
LMRPKHQSGANLALPVIRKWRSRFWWSTRHNTRAQTCSCFDHCSYHNSGPQLFFQLGRWWRNGACSWWLRCCLCLLALFLMTVWLVA